MLLSYGARNLLDRRRYVLPTVAAVGASIAAVVALYSLARSTEGVVRRTQAATDMVVLSHGAMTESASSLTREDLAEVRASPGVAVVANAPQLSAEYVSTLFMNELESGLPKGVRVRGVDPAALDIHSHVHLISGRFPRSGEPGLVVGGMLLGRFTDLHEGGMIRLGMNDWPVLGVLESDDAYGSEVWCDRRAISDQFHHPNASVAHVRLQSVDRREEFAQHVQRIKGLEAITEDELTTRRMSWSAVDSYIWTLWGVCVLLALGALFACMNALHGSLQSRVRELATLMAVGFTRWQVWLLALQESVLISLAGALLGLPLAALIEGRTFSFGTIFYSIHIDAVALSIGLAAVGVIGLAGGALAALQVRRMNVLASLRSG